MKLSRISLAVLPLCSMFSLQAAVYSVVEVGQVEALKSTYAAGINNNGDAVFNGVIKQSRSNNAGGSYTDYQLFNFPIDLSLIDFEDEDIQEYFTEQQLNDLLNGNLSAETLRILLNVNPTTVNQPVGDVINFYKPQGSSAQNLLLRDTNATRGNSEYLLSINDSGVAVGFATPVRTYQSFTPAATEETPEPEEEFFWVSELPLTSAVVVKDNVVTQISAPYTELAGGFTVARKISSDNRIAGYGSVGMDETAYETILEACDGETQPVDFCLASRTSELIYDQRALVWQLQADGSVAEPQIYGYLGDKNTGTAFEGENFNDINYYSQATAVNKNGIAVGLSMYSDSSRTERYLSNNFYVNGIYRQAHASIFVDDQVLPIVDPDEWSIISTSVVGSTATDINDNDVIVGYANKVINSGVRSKMFVYDYASGQLTFPSGFFASSSTQANAINNSGQIVGNAEVIIGGTTTRRKHGFIYDMTNASFTDLNSLIGCNSGYTIVDAADINDNGVIAATALVKRENRDLFGEPVLDAAGNPVYEDFSTVVHLTPVANGEAENCDTDSTEYKRQGGSWHYAWLLATAGLLWRRRSVRK